MLRPMPPDQLCVPNLHGHFAREHTYDHLMWSYLMLSGQIFMNFYSPIESVGTFFYTRG